VFGISFSEIAVLAVVTLIVVGPQRLPSMLRTVGGFVGKLRRMTTEVRQQTGIDEILREEGITGGLAELRGMMRGDVGTWAGRRRADVPDPYGRALEVDRTREYPLEGPDSYDALPDDLVSEEPAA
jgi:sec-independent protein translocase protein TatB